MAGTPLFAYLFFILISLVLGLHADVLSAYSWLGAQGLLLAGLGDHMQFWQLNLSCLHVMMGAYPLHHLSLCTACLIPTSF